MRLIPPVALLLILAVVDSLGPGDMTPAVQCRCINKEKRPIRRYIAAVEVHYANSHCSEGEIIATLKKTGKKICLDPKAQWVRRILQMEPKYVPYKYVKK